LGFDSRKVGSAKPWAQFGGGHGERVPPLFQTGDISTRFTWSVLR